MSRLGKFLFAGLVVIGCSLHGQSINDIRYFLQSSEGYRNVPYRDAGGWSVGIGHHIQGYCRDYYSDAEISQLFYEDLGRAYATARSGILDFDGLPRLAKEVVLGVIWGVGRDGFMKFKNFRYHLSIRDYDKAADDLEDSRWARQVGPNRTDEYVLFLEVCKPVKIRLVK